MAFPADALRRIREERGMSQAQLAAAAGSKQKNVSNWEQGIREPSWSNVMALCAALGVPCTVFAPADSPPPPRKPGRPKKPAG